MGMLGACFMGQGNLSDAERILRESLEIIKFARPENPVAIADGMCSLSDTIVRRLTLVTEQLYSPHVD